MAVPIPNFRLDGMVRPIALNGGRVNSDGGRESFCELANGKQVC